MNLGMEHLVEGKFKLLLVISSILFYLSPSHFVRSDHRGKIYELKVSHPHGEHYVMNTILHTEESVHAISTTSTTTPTPPGRIQDQLKLKYSQECERDLACCYQYTWPGRFDNGSTTFTCEKYHRESGSKEPCKSPIVFTTQNTSTKFRTRPDLNHLIKFADENYEQIYCKRSSACIKYSYFVDGEGGKRHIFNETKFCGIATSLNTQTSAKRGCYDEKIGAYTRQVCVCYTDRCNGSSRISTSNFLPLQFALFFLIIFTGWY